MQTDTRAELMALRAEFKELAGHYANPWASWTEQAGRPAQWKLCGGLGTERRFDGLAQRAAALAGIPNGLSGWLDSLGTPSLMGQSVDGALLIGELQGIADLSVQAIDKLLAAAPIIEQGDTISAADRTKPMTLKQAAKLMGKGTKYGSGKDAAEWLSKSIADGSIPCEQITRQQRVFSKQSFPETVWPKILPE